MKQLSLIVLILTFLVLCSLLHSETIATQGFEAGDTWEYSANSVGSGYWGIMDTEFGGTNAHSGEHFWTSWLLGSNEGIITFANQDLPLGYVYSINFHYYTKLLSAPGEYCRYALSYDSGSTWTPWTELLPNTQAWTLVSIEIPVYEHRVMLRVAARHSGTSKYVHWDSFVLNREVAPPAAPVVYNLQIAQRTDGSGLVDICYDLFDQNNDPGNISLLVSTDAGARYAFVPDPANLSGDIGSGIATGTDKHIVWNAGAEAAEFESNDYRFRILTEDGTTYGTVATPVFDPPAGTYTSAQTVTITCATAGATIYYVAFAQAEDLFFSEYVEGVSNNKAIEIFNGTGDAVDLTGYSVKLGPNGGTWSYTNSIDLTGSLANGEVYVIANGGSNAAILAQADITHTVTYFNGDDTLGLFNGETLIDIIGVYQLDPGIAWDVAGTSAATLNHTLIRKPHITAGNVNWTVAAGTNLDDSEWIIYPQDYTTDLGMHTFNIGGGVQTGMPPYNGTEPDENSAVYTTPITVSTNTSLKAKAFMAMWAASETASTVYTIMPTNFVLVQGGTFNNGTSDVTVSSFYMDKYELTQAGYQAVMGSNPASGYGVGSDYPVYHVSWFNAIEYCNRRSMQEGLIPCYSYSTYGTNPSDWPLEWNTHSNYHDNVNCNWTASGYRLPTEMEWMFAARGGNQTHNYTYSGSNTIEDVAWYSTNSGGITHIVGQKLANELGIFDMSGNVWEWVWDAWGAYPTTPQTNPTGPLNGTQGIVRGGYRESTAEQCWVTSRGTAGFGGGVYEGIGLRCVRTSP